MATSSSILGKRNFGDYLENKPILKKHQDNKDSSILKTTLLIRRLSPNTKTSDIVGLFKNVAQVVRVRLNVNRKDSTMSFGFVDFSSAHDANNAMLLKNGACLHNTNIILRVVKKAPRPPGRKGFSYFRYKEYLRRESLPIEDEDDESPPCFVEEVLFVAHLSPQTNLLHIKDFFKDVGEVVSVRLIVNPQGKHVGYGFVEFASANEAKKAMENKNGNYFHGHKIFLEAAKTTRPRPKYNLLERLCYEDYLRRKNAMIQKDDETMAVAVREKSLFFANLSLESGISDILDFFKEVGQVVSVRLIVNPDGEHLGYGYVEFTSPDEAKKVLEQKTGEYLHENLIFLSVAMKVSFSYRPKFCIDHKVWYEDYLRRERLLIAEDEAEEGLDDIPDITEEVAARRKTVFAANLPVKIAKIKHVFKKVGEIVSIQFIVDDTGKHLGCGFLEFASVAQAEEALYFKNRRYEIYLDVAEMAPYPLRPKYNLAEKLWFKVENFLREDEEYDQDDDDDEEEPNLKVPLMSRFCGKKVIFSYKE
ncbi:unnamed protein product [Cochlearia groenlandica]